jgi:hypothetical protein
MYASEPQVRSLTRNKRSGMTLVELEAIGATIDAEIDARLSALFHWPVTVSGDPLNEPPPALIVSAASYLTAALIEMEAYAQNEAGGAVPNPYGRTLEKRGEALLQRIERGESIIPRLERVRQTASVPAPKIHSPVHGFGRGVRTNDRR